MTSLITNNQKNNNDKNQELSNGTKYLIYFFLVIIIFTLSEIINIKIIYKPLFDWWKQNDGDKYNNLINLFNVVSAYNNRYVYTLSYLASSPMTTLTLQQGQFLMGELFPYQTWISDTGEPFGILTPRSICESIKPAPGEHDPIFDKWYKENAIINGEAQVYTSKLMYDSTGKVIKDPNTGSYGVYPSDTDFESWKGLINEWLGDQWKWETVKDGSSTIVVARPKSGNIKDSLAKWFMNDTGRGDNFLARYGITPDCPLVTYFVNGFYSVNGMIVDAVAFENLLSPSGPGAGGWVGYMKGMGDDTSFDEYKKYIRTRVDYQLIPKSDRCKKEGEGAKQKRFWMSFSISALPLLGFAATAGPWGALAISVCAIVSGVISGVKARNQC